MAVALTTSQNVDYGSITWINGASDFSISFCLKPSSSPGGDERYVTRWEGGTAQFLVQDDGNGDIGMLVSGAGGWFGRRTGSGTITNGSQHAVCITFSGDSSSPTMHICVDGVDETLVEWFASNGVTALSTSTAPLEVCNEASGSGGVDGDWSEFAMWDVALDTSAALSMSNGVSPLMYPAGLQLYDRMLSSTRCLDEVGGIDPTVGGSDASHPNVIYPSAQILQFPPASGGGPAPSHPVNPFGHPFRGALGGPIG